MRNVEFGFPCIFQAAPVIFVFFRYPFGYAIWFIEHQVEWVSALELIISTSADLMWTERLWINLSEIWAKM